jgi:hypothetical protein
VIISFSLFHSRETGKLYSGLGAPLSNWLRQDELLRGKSLS